MFREKNNRYKILYFPGYGKAYGGAAHTLLMQAVLMREAGHTVTVFFSDYAGRGMNDEYQKICQRLGIEWVWATYQISSQPEDIDLVCLDRNYEKLKRTVISYGPDILHSVQLNPGVELAGRELGIPHIMNIYPLLPEFFKLDYMDIFPHYHICDSVYYARKWQYCLKTDSVCIRTAVSEGTKRENAFLNPVIRFLCVGTIYKEKNQLAVIKAFHKALESNLRGELILCGYQTGGYAGECLDYIRKNGLEHKIILKGFCTDIGKEYASGDVLICGSTRESYPNVISEAMANGLVIISTPVGGVPEVIEDGTNGYLTRDCSEEAICQKLLEFESDLAAGKIEKILENEKKTFEKHHSAKEVTAQLISYYGYVLNDYHRNKNNKNEKLIGIADVRACFGKLFEKFAARETYFTEPEKAAVKLWYLYYTKPYIMAALQKGAGFYIWGTGRYGTAVKELIDVFLPEIRVSGFLDSHKKGMFLLYNIYHPDEILQDENTVIFIAAVNGQEEMTEKLKAHNKIYNRDYFILSARRW